MKCSMLRAYLKMGKERNFCIVDRIVRIVSKNEFVIS